MAASAPRRHNPLARYQRMRDFERTAEPRGAVRPRAGHSFVVQKHDATALHYDFRLELDGVLKSWAVPKGPSLSPADKRLAMQVEDHPVSYRDFEGTIAEGGYGADPVIVWDRGNWRPIGDPHEGLRKGALKFELEGQKLQGEFSLVRLPRGGRKPAWLLIKRRDEHAREGEDAQITERAPESVLSGRSIEDIQTGAETPAGKRRKKVGQAERVGRAVGGASAPTGKASRKSVAAKAAPTKRNRS
jgi:bifunctional non-homologous end joining protein LigD